MADRNLADAVPLTATQAAEQIANNALSSKTLVQGCLGRVAELEPSVRAWAFLDEKHALEQARAADAAVAAGRGIGPLHGVPIGIKDIIDTADMPTEHGSPVFAGHQPSQDAVCVEALRRAGAIILGKTVTTELATHIPSRTCNPVNPEYTPGGSSSGSAAAVACGMVPIAVGTQTGGSVIRPASYCGVYGYKPTFGLIPRVGVLTQSHTLDTIGVFGRCVEDLALAVDAMQGSDARDAASLVTSRSRLFATATQDWPLAPLFAFVKGHAWDEADPVTREAFGELVEVLGAQAAEVIIDSTYERGWRAARTIQNVEMAMHYGPDLDRAPGLFSPGLAARIEEGRRVGAVDYVAALNARKELYGNVCGIFGDYGTILTPAALGPAPKDLGTTGSPVMCGFWTYLGVPAVTLPLLEADGMPLGVQLVGARGDDGRLLRTARSLVRRLANGTASLDRAANH